MYFNVLLGGMAYDADAERLEFRRRRELRRRLLYRAELLRTGRTDNVDEGTEFGQLLNRAKKMKSDGDKEFEAGRYGHAETEYQSALGCLNSSDLACTKEAQDEQYLELSYSLCIKLCNTYFKMGEFKNGFRLAKTALERQQSDNLQYEPNFWCAKCLFEMGKIDEGFRHINIAKSSSSAGDDDLNELYEKFQKKQKELDDIQKAIVVPLYI